nr:glucose dehydrogenase [FAD, quinone]-like [Leptinotarsa decemlineata]
MDPSYNITDPCPNNLQGVPAQLFLTLLNSLMAAKCSLGSSQLYPDDYAPKLMDGDEFDFIVIGAGSAGSMVANKLSENKNWKVLVLEAGEHPSATSDIPSLTFSLQGTAEDWQYKTEFSEKSCLGIEDSICKWPRGKALGGCSSVNYMLYVRGNKRDYDEWAESGNVGWDWESVFPHFKEFERLESEVFSGLYGTNGSLPITRYESGIPVAQTIKEAGRVLGYPSLDEENPVKPLGFLNILNNIENGTRFNAAKAFLGSVKDRENLSVARQSFVKKIIIDEKSGTAKGIEVAIGNRTLKLYAKNEIILSAGAINSPQLLMISGIGPKKHLGELGINVIKDLPVGQNLQDHLIFMGFLVKTNSNAVKPQNPQDATDDIYKYMMYRSGEMSRMGITNLMGFVNTKNDSIYPNIQFHHLLFRPGDTYILRTIYTAMGFNENVTNRMFEYTEKNPVLQPIPTLLRPISKGEILLRSDSPFKTPIIRTGYFTDEKDEDMNELLTGISYVVNSRLMVHGLKNLRVVDASIMPNIVSGNTNAASMMIGHKGGVMIVEDWK